MIAIIDIGNTAVKGCRINDDKMPGKVFTISVESLEVSPELDFLDNITAVCLACSGDEALAEKLTTHLDSNDVEVYRLDRNGALPFNSMYAPGQAGIDRLANVTAAIRDVGYPSIVVDAGSAITLEVINAEGIFAGGAILPGFGLQATALHKGTASLPEVTIEAATPTIGTDTTRAIRSGILNGCLGAVHRLVRLALDEPGMAAAAIIFTGGDGELISESLQLPNSLELPDLTLRGLFLLACYQHPNQLEKHC